MASSLSPAAKLPEGDIKLGTDEPGCKDSALLARITGCSIIQCDSKMDAENVKIAGGVAADGTSQDEVLDGAMETIYYLCPAKISVNSVVKLSEAALIKAGFKMVFNGRDGEDFPLISARKGDQWIQISTYMYNDLSAYIQTAMTAQPEDANPAEAFLEAFARDGKTVLFGISFENDRLSPESDKVLTELAVFLVRQPGLKVRLLGHVDARNDKAAAIQISKERADAVATWLAEHGVEANRISTEGIGDSQPVTDNTSDENRARNRRIELIRQP